MKVAIIGGGLAGCACAYILGKAGVKATIYEKREELAAGASGNQIGLVGPRLSAFRTPESDFYAAAFSMAVQEFDSIGEAVNWRKCGALHFITDDKKQTRFHKAVQNWGWPQESMRLVSAEDASDIAGIPLSQEALYLPEAGAVNPRALCEYYAKDADIVLNTEISDIHAYEADAVILAGGMGVLGFEAAQALPLESVRGQITQIKTPPALDNLQCNLHYGGYCSVPQDGQTVIGASFQRWLDHCNPLDGDDEDNIKRLCNILPDIMPRDVKILDHRASLRTATKGHFPVIGPVGQSTYISTGHGSHGIVSSLAGAVLLADMILDRPRCLPQDTITALSPYRFTGDRQAGKG